MSQPNINSRYYELAEKWDNRTITPAEMRELESWFDYVEDITVEIPSSFVAGEEEHKSRIFAAINRKTNNELTPIKRVFPKYWIRIAAAAILVFGVGAYLWTTNKKTTPSPAVSNNPGVIKPGNNKAVLTLADGKQITLDGLANGNIAQQGSVEVLKLSDGKISYNLKGAATEEVLENTMSTPRGGKYELILPDGSKVWLNSASSITYPVVFVGNKREVKISGEAYFEIVNNKNKPFIVDIDGKNSVEVLGTSFNINSYKDENLIATTLLSGSVRVNNKVDAVVIKPGQQAYIKPDLISKKINVKDVNADQVISWKTGVFNFNDVDIQSAMRQIARWYDVEIIYNGPKPTDVLTGELPMDASIDRVLNILEKIGVRFKIEGKKIIVMK